MEERLQIGPHSLWHRGAFNVLPGTAALSAAAWRMAADLTEYWLVTFGLMIVPLGLLMLRRPNGWFAMLDDNALVISWAGKVRRIPCSDILSVESTLNAVTLTIVGRSRDKISDSYFRRGEK
jgi:hypothetical protein